MDAPAPQVKRPTTLVSWHTAGTTWAALVSFSLVILLLSTALLLVQRRSAGALAHPLSAPWMLLAGLSVACAVIVSRRLLPQQKLRLLPAWMRRTIQWGTTLAVAMFAIALSIDGTSLLALSMYLMLIVGAEFLAEYGSFAGIQSTIGRLPLKRLRFLPHGKQRDQADTLPSQTQSVPDATSSPTQNKQIGLQPIGSVLDGTDQEILEEESDENVWQQMSRLRTPEGEVITGWVKTDFQPGERTAVLHVAFCPPLLRTPKVDIEQLSGPAARIKVGQVLPQGARFEIRLNTSGDETETLLLEFVAMEQHEEQN